MEQTLFYVFIGIFSLTAIITLLGITGVLKLVKERYLNILFTSLILEVVAAVVLLFQNTDFQANQQKLSEIIFQAEGINMEEKAAPAYLLKRLQAPLANSAQIDSLMNLLKARDTEVAQYKDEIGQLNKSFYTKIYHLKKLIYKYDNFINLGFNSSQKEDAFTLLQEIFESLQILEPAAGPLDITKLRKTYRTFKMQHFSTEDDKKYEYIFQSDLIHFIQAYLNLTSEEG